ncbi:polysaccharide deacetylase family protein [Actinoplanes sp. NPDC049118]|uniref:polysaccharide deacetylase family protein n=1 Tax=Actinoplanes sp. NPDC049118 TaxID=3155769 RepID=UPI0034062D76
MPRRLIINCDDFGMYPAVNAGVLHALEDGIASSCSLMPPCPAAAGAMSLLRDRPHLPFGIHLTLFCDTPAYPWAPLTARGEVPSLLNAAGEFFRPDQVPALLAQARAEEVAVEFRAQIRAVLDARLSPTHLDWHCLADGGREDLFDVTLALADEHGLGVRAWLGPARRRLRRLGRPVTDHDFLDSFRLGLEAKFLRYAELLRALPEGTSEWAVHPGLADDEARRIDPGWRVRATDHEFLTAPQAAALLAAEGITLVGHRASGTGGETNLPNVR